jgi:hydroxymethylpyrimidine/phosphomethylpyrimidine kinase
MIDDTLPFLWGTVVPDGQRCRRIYATNSANQAHVSHAMPHLAPPIVMTFAPIDGTSGAGAYADVLTIASIGCHPAGAATAIAVQDSTSLRELYALDPDWVDEHARAVLEDMPVAAFKVGALPSVDLINVISEIAADYPHVPLVLDPLLHWPHADTRTLELHLDALTSLLLPLTTVVAVGTASARRIAGVDDAQHGDVLAVVSEKLLATGCGYALLCGKHEPTPEVINTLFDATGRLRTDKWQRISGNFHGAGSTLTSALAALLAQGMAVPEAASEAQAFTWETLNAGFHPGMGRALPDRFFWVGSEEDDGT